LKQGLHKQLQRSFLHVDENFAKSSKETKITVIKLSRINLIPSRFDVIFSRIDCLSGLLFPHVTIKNINYKYSFYIRTYVNKPHRSLMGKDLI